MDYNIQTNIPSFVSWTTCSVRTVLIAELACTGFSNIIRDRAKEDHHVNILFAATTWSRQKMIKWVNKIIIICFIM